MEVLSAPRLILSNAYGSLGSRLVGMGLALALRKQGKSIACAVRGSEITHAARYRRIAGRVVRCLDDNILSEGQTVGSLADLAVGSDIILVEGARGLFDSSVPGSLRGTDAELARLARIPVILVVDGRDIGGGVVPLVKGFSEFVPGLPIDGVILYNCRSGGPSDAQFLRESLHLAHSAPLIGCLPQVPGAEILGGTTGPLERSVPLPHQFLGELERAVSSNLDIPLLLSIATGAPSLTLEGREDSRLDRRCRIAVTDDPCFQSCFQDNLDILRRNGVEIAPFSPLADSSLPKNIGGLYVSGANLREYGSDISANKGLRKAIREFYERGGVIYSEGGGSAYLAQTFTFGEPAESFEGVGVLPIEVTIKESDSWMYNEAVTIEDSIIGPPGLIVKGIDTHEFGTSKGQRVLTALRASPYGSTYRHEGLSPGAQVLSTFFYLHWGSNPEIGKHIADAASVFAQSQQKIPAAD